MRMKEATKIVETIKWKPGFSLCIWTDNSALDFAFQQKTMLEVLSIMTLLVNYDNRQYRIDPFWPSTLMFILY